MDDCLALLLRSLSGNFSFWELVTTYLDRRGKNMTKIAGGRKRFANFWIFIRFSTGLLWSLQMCLFKFWKLAILCIEIWKSQIRRSATLHSTITIYSNSNLRNTSYFAYINAVLLTSKLRRNTAGNVNRPDLSVVIKNCVVTPPPRKIGSRSRKSLLWDTIVGIWFTEL